MCFEWNMYGDAASQRNAIASKHTHKHSQQASSPARPVPATASAPPATLRPLLPLRRRDGEHTLMLMPCPPPLPHQPILINASLHPPNRQALPAAAAAAFPVAAGPVGTALQSAGGDLGKVPVRCKAFLCVYVCVFVSTCRVGVFDKPHTQTHMHTLIKLTITTGRRHGRHRQGRAPVGPFQALPPHRPQDLAAQPPLPTRGARAD